MATESEEEAIPSKRRYTSFCDKWMTDPLFSKWVVKKDEYTAFCKLCQMEFSIKYEGSRMLLKHTRTQRHTKIESAHKVSQSISNFITPKQFKEEELVSRAELASVYHNVRHGLSYTRNSLDCQLKLSSTIYCDSKIAAKMSCGRTKGAAIVRNVLSPYVQENISKELNECSFFR